MYESIILFREIIHFLYMQKLLNQPQRHLLRCPSHQQTLKHGTNTTIHTSCTSIESTDEEFRKTAIKWLMQFDRKVTKDTNYLSVWYLEVAIKNGLVIKQSNWQLAAAAIILLASKMNEIYPPSIASVIKKATSVTPTLTKEALIEMECKILNLLDFGVAIQSPYNLIVQILGDSKKDIEECQKLLKIIIYNKEIHQNEAELLAYAMVYLIARQKIDQQLQGEERTRVKIVAQKIYNFYKDMRKSHQTHKTLKPNPKPSTPEEKPSQQRLLDRCPSKQNMGTSSTALYSSGNSQQGSNKKGPSYAEQLSRANSYKFIPKAAFTESANLKEKKLYNCLSRDDLKNSLKTNQYYYS